jgi:hypothetical protein
LDSKTRKTILEHLIEQKKFNIIEKLEAHLIRETLISIQDKEENFKLKTRDKVMMQDEKDIHFFFRSEKIRGRDSNNEVIRLTTKEYFDSIFKDIGLYSNLNVTSEKNMKGRPI